MEDTFITEGKFDITKFTPVGRLGYRDYANVKESYELLRPDDN